MNIPESLKIGGHQYKVEFPYTFTERFDITGQADFVQNLIRIPDANCGDKASDSYIAVSLIHEILHCIDHNTGHNIFEGSEGEKKIEGLSEGIFQVLVDNGYLKEYTTGTVDAVPNNYNHKRGDIITIGSSTQKYVLDYNFPEDKATITPITKWKGKF